MAIGLTVADAERVRVAVRWKRRVAPVALSLSLSLAGWGHAWAAAAAAAGPYDGEWKGRARPGAGERCESGAVTFTVRGHQVTGRATLGDEERSIIGTVADDGDFGGTLGFQYVTGRFGPQKFTGTVEVLKCTWTLSLDRVGPSGRN